MVRLRAQPGRPQASWVFTWGQEVMWGPSPPTISASPTQSECQDNSVQRWVWDGGLCTCHPVSPSYPVVLQGPGPELTPGLTAATPRVAGTHPLSRGTLGSRWSFSTSQTLGGGRA